MLKAEELFSAIVRFIGLIVFLAAIVQIILISYTSASPGFYGSLNTFINQLILVILGLYMLNGAQSIVKFSYPDAVQNEKWSVKTLFNLFVKTLGLILLILAIMGLLNMMQFLLNSAPYNSTILSSPLSYGLATNLIELILGTYLLRSAKIFEQIAFRNEINADKEVED